MLTKLGQNFLTNENIARKIVDSANLSFKDNVLEIGPGKGILTKYIAQKARKVLAVEIDKKLISGLTSRSHLEYTRGETSVEIIEGDILKINLPTLIEKNNFHNYKVVANLPYYITSKIIRLLLETKYPPQEMILMVQKEVGERIVALDKKESILSISVKFYAEPEILFYVSKEKFNPVPEVDSAVIRIKRKKQIPDVYPVKSREAGLATPAFNRARFFSLVRAGFSAKRKMLVNNLSAGLHIPKAEATEIIKKAGLDSKQRAEKLGVEEWVKLYDNFYN